MNFIFLSEELVGSGEGSYGILNVFYPEMIFEKVIM